MPGSAWSRCEAPLRWGVDWLALAPTSCAWSVALVGAGLGKSSPSLAFVGLLIQGQVVVNHLLDAQPERCRSGGLGAAVCVGGGGAEPG